MSKDMKIIMENYRVGFLSEEDLVEQEDANKKIDMAQSEAQKIASKLTSEIETVSKNSGLDMATLSSLVKQFMDQEMQ